MAELWWKASMRARLSTRRGREEIGFEQEIPIATQGVSHRLILNEGIEK